uniref:Uncharacterized protein n=1 Tax=Daphnia galeata TaxID=27404 RepID=A0A8J2RKY8_9CRUS|nr:unnamed protein product [Daphnia galeata]
MPLRLLFAVTVVCCCLTTCIESRAQFSNMRVFRTSGMFNKDHWRPMDILKSFKSNKEQETDSSNSRAAEIVSASSIKRVSMASLLQQLNQVNNGKKEIFFPTPSTTNQEEKLSIPITIIESNHSVVTPVVKESTIRRVKLPVGSISYSRNGPASTGPAILLNINPHLQRSTRVPSSEPPTTEATTTTTTTTEPTTTEPSTTTTTTEPSTSTSTEPCVTKVYIKAKPHEQQATKHLADKAKLPAKLRADNNFASSKKLSQMPNSPIYYIKLPASSFVSGRTPHKEDALPQEFFKQSPIFVATTRRPSNSSVEEILTTESSSETSLSTTTRFPPLTNSRVINIKGPFVFNGKPGGIYSAPAPYRPPNYLDLLHQLYPKLKRAQFIRR